MELTFQVAIRMAGLLVQVWIVEVSEFNQT
jgi:hypothetical protein